MSDDINGALEAGMLAATDAIENARESDVGNVWKMGIAAGVAAFHRHLADPRPGDTIYDATRRFRHRRLAEAVERALSEAT